MKQAIKDFLRSVAIGIGMLIILGALGSSDKDVYKRQLLTMGDGCPFRPLLYKKPLVSTSPVWWEVYCQGFTFI